MKASDIILDGFDYSSESILEWSYIDNNSILNKNVTALVDSTASALQLILPENPQENDEVRIVDAKSTFKIHNVTLACNEKIMASDDDLVLDKKGTYISLVYINDSYGWKYNIANVNKIDSIPVDTSNITDEYVLKYNEAGNTFVFQQLQAQTDQPLLSGVAQALELTEVLITISNYSSLISYDVNVEGGSYERTGGVITWTLPDVASSMDKIITVTATEPGKEGTSNTHTVNVLNVISDAAITYNDDCVDYPECREGKQFVYTDGEIQDGGDNDFHDAQVSMDLVGSEQFEIVPDDPLLYDGPDQNLGNLFIDGETTIEDENGTHTITVNGDTAITTSKKKYGTSSIYFDGSGDYLSIPDSDDWDFGSGDFTIDFWINTTQSTFSIGGQSNGAGNQHGFAFGLRVSDGAIRLITSHVNSTNADITSVTSSSINDGNWNHVAFVRYNDNVYCFTNGNLVDTYSFPVDYTIQSINNTLDIGRYPNSPGEYFNGYLDQYRITKGTALWTEDFEILPEYSTTSNLLLNYPISGALSNGDTIISGKDTNATLHTVGNVVMAMDGLQPNSNFKVVTYTGDDSTNRKIKVGFKPDLVWIKSRTYTWEHYIYDNIRGVGNIIRSNSSAAQISDTQTVKSFDDDGFTLGTNDGNNAVNHTYVAWCWKAGNEAVINTDGTIDSIVSAGNGFSIVKYTGNMTAKTLGHGLSTTPKMIIVKCLTQANHWLAWHEIFGNTTPTCVELDGNNAAGYRGPGTLYWNSTLPTDSVFSIGVDTEVNNNGYEYIAYCFADVEGISKIGSYTGAGAVGHVIDCGFRPAYVMIKRTDSSGNWWVLDNKRDTYNPNKAVLYPDVTNAEATASGGVDFTSNGFTIQDTSPNINASGGSYIFMALSDTEPMPQYSLTNLTPSLSATYGDIPDNVYVDDNTMFMSKGGETDDIEAKVLDNVRQGSFDLTEYNLFLDGETNVSDKTGNHTVTAFGNAHANTGEKIVGDSSIYFDGSGDYLTIPDSSDWDFGTGDFTIDTWFYVNTSGFHSIFNHAAVGGNISGNTHYLIFNDIQKRFDYYYMVGGVNKCYENWHYTTEMPINTWHHVAITRKNGDMFMFFDGEARGRSDWNGGLANGSFSGITGLVYIGINGADMTYPFNGYMDNFRITKGKALFTENFVPDPDKMYEPASYDVIGTYPTSGAITTSSDLLIDSVRNTVDTVTEEQVEISNKAFGIVTYKGTSSIKSLIGLGFEPGLVWIKGRTTGQPHNIFDIIRGPGHVIKSSSSIAELYKADNLMSFDEDGFTLGADNVGSNNNEVNALYDYVAWCWKADKMGYPNNGETTPLWQEEKYSLDSGLSIIRYTGNGTVGRKVKHSLGVEPSLIFIKNLDSTSSWLVYSKELGGTKYLLLNETSGAVTNVAGWNNTDATSDEFTVSYADNNNGLNNEHIAYCFTDIEGVSKFGSYTGTGVVGLEVNVGFEPAYLVIKRTDSDNNWNIFDNKRDINDPKSLRLELNTADTEVVSNHLIDFTSTGFTLQNTQPGSNANNGEYIYMAFKDSEQVTKYLIDTDTPVTEEPTTCADITPYSEVNLDNVSNHSTEVGTQSTVWTNLFINGQTMVDQNGTHPVTAHGDASVSSDTSKYGVNSIKFDGDGDYLTVPDASDWNFGSNNFTIDYWEYRISAGAGEPLIRKPYGSLATFMLGHCDAGDGGRSLVHISNNGSSWAISGELGKTSYNKWVHRALVRYGNLWFAFENGIIFNTFNSSINMTNGNTELLIGKSGLKFFDGYMQNIRIVKGHALWTQGFDLTEDALFYNNTSQFTQQGEKITLPADIRQLSAGVDLNTDEVVKNTIIDTWKVE